MMVNLSTPVTFQDLGQLGAQELLNSIKTYCSSGGAMHQDSLKAVVLKLTYLSRDLQIKQQERDEAAVLASDLANAAVKTYGQNSVFCSALLGDIRAIVGQ